MTAQTFATKYGPWAVVTGASSGIGEQFAKHLASLGLNVALVARRQEILKQIADSLAAEHNVKCLPIVADLSLPSGSDIVKAACDPLDVGLVINNAGMESHGAFVHDDSKTLSNLIAINVTSVTHLAHIFAKRFANSRRDRGAGIMFISSIAKKGLPFVATYSSTKSYVSTLSILLRKELSEFNVDVLCVEPGVVKTPMTQGDIASLGWPTVSVETVVDEALSALIDGAMCITPGEARDVSGEQALEQDMDEAVSQMKAAWDPQLFHPSD